MKDLAALRVLSEMSRIVVSSLDLDESLNMLVEQASNIADHRRSCIYLLSDEIEEDRKIYVAAGFPKEDHGIGFKRNLKERPVIEKVLREGKMEVINDIENHPLLTIETKDWLRGFNIKSIIFYPIIYQEKKIGVFVLDSPQKIGEEEINFMSIICNLAAAVIHTAVRYRDSQETIKLMEAKSEKIARIVRLATIGEDTAKMAHEIRSPLVAIGGFAQRIVKYLDKYALEHDKLNNYADIIVEEVAELEKRINNMLLFSKGEIYPQFTQVNVLLNEVVQAATKRNGIIAKTDFGSVPQVLIDRPSIERAIVNILNNARDAIEDEEKRVYIKTYQDDHQVAVRIANRGKKIPVEIMDKIFQPLYTTKEKGTGLGLAMVYHILNINGANIEADSTDEETSFTLKFPIP